MSPRWESPLDRSSPRDAAMLAEVLGALHGQLSNEESHTEHGAEVAELISAAVAELHRLAPFVRQEGGVAPVLGSGVLQELLRRRRSPLEHQAPEPARTVDERL